MSSCASYSFGLVAGLLALGACASQQGPDTQRYPDGSIAIRCRAPLSQCLARADTLCKGKTYEVLRARDQRDTYGPEMGTAKVEVRSSEAIIRCTSGGRPMTGWEPLAPSAAPAAAAPPPVRACVPGTTQACIGPGKCEGGQSCLPDASAFGPCDCGTLGPPVTAPAAAAPAPAEPAMGAAPPPAPTTPSTTTGKPAPAAPGTAAPGVAPATPLKK